MAASTLKQTTIMEDQSTMALFTVLGYKLVSEETKEYFML
jgi:hypothetical protein